MQLHELKPKHKSKRKKRIGRGGKRGTYSGRGVKGQKSRAGHKIRPEIRDFIKKIPKKRGYRFKSIKKKPQIVNLKDLQKHFSAQGRSASGGKKPIVITPEVLLKAGLISKIKGRMPEVKILGQGKLTKKLTVEGCSMSESVKKAIGKTKMVKKSKAQSSNVKSNPKSK